MKIRTGFVSNSSSSSFLLMFIRPNEKIFTSLDEFRREFYMRPEQTVCDTSDVTFEQVSEEIFNDLKKTARMRENDIKRWVRENKYGVEFFEKTNIGTMVDAIVDYDDHDTSPEHAAVTRAKDIITEHYRRRFEQWVLEQANRSDVHVYHLEYEDSGDLGTALEHGRHWDEASFMVIRVSHH